MTTMESDKARQLTVLKMEKSRAELRLTEALRIKESCECVIEALEIMVEQLEEGEA